MARASAVAGPANWFRRLGAPLSAADATTAAGYAQALGLGSLELQLTVDAAAARAFSRDPDWDCGWWSREESERELLMREAQARLGIAETLDSLSAAIEPHTDSSFRLAMEAPALAAVGEAFARAASGALMLSLHCRALARLCGRGESHLFMRKCDLFSRGRWPLGVREQTLFLF